MDNLSFLKAIFGQNYHRAHVTSFTQDPSAIPSGESGRCWAGGAYGDKQLLSNSNQFYTVSLFHREDGRANRRKKNFEECYVIALDDVKEKLPIVQVSRLPPPSIVLKSSLYSEQWLYLLVKPETNADRIDNLHDGLIKNGLAPDGKDPGQKGITRYLRLPEGVNTKAKRIAENSGTPYQCNVTEWHPDRRYTLEQLAAPFRVDLDATRADKRVDGAEDISDHPLLHTEAIQIKSALSAGRFDCVCPWVEEHTDGDDSGSAVFTNGDGTIGFRCHHGSCDHRNGRHLLQFIEQQSPGFGEKLTHWQAVRAFTPVVDTGVSPWGGLLDMSVKGNSHVMKQKMNADKFILKDIAILGQWTVFYAGPNTGKTLLTLWLLREAIKSGDIKAEDVVYANCDDTYKGGVQKLEIAEASGFHMLLPTENGFRPDKLLGLMQQTAEAGEALGKVIILDTLKKFTDLMDKRVSSKFGEVARSFVSAGGSLICLAHVNKHKDGEGKSIYAGTADIRDDADCVYTIELVGKESSWEGSTAFTVQFENSKARGAVAQTMAFHYTKSKGSDYPSLFDSVKRLNHDEVERVAREAQLTEQLKEDAVAIEAITTAVTNSKHAKTEIVEFVLQMSDIPRNKVRTILERYTGSLWTMTRGQHNICFYSLNTAPEPPVSFF